MKKRIKYTIFIGRDDEPNRQLRAADKKATMNGSTTDLPLLYFLSFSFLFFLFLACFYVLWITKLKWEGISQRCPKTSGELPTHDTVTYDVVGSQKPADVVTYGVVRTLSKVVKMSHISRSYQPYVDTGSTFHYVMQFGVMIWLSKNFKCSTLQTRSKQCR